MRHVTPLRIRFTYSNQVDSPKRLEAVYDRIFTHAKQNILERRKKEDIGNMSNIEMLSINKYNKV